MFTLLFAPLLCKESSTQLAVHSLGQWLNKDILIIIIIIIGIIIVPAVVKASMIQFVKLMVLDMSML